MKSLVKKIPFLMLIAVTFSASKFRNTDIHQFSDTDTKCNNDSSCPTWFICNAEKRCKCDNRYMDRILCDDNTQTSAILFHNCVTYDKEKGSTFVGTCYYNSQNFNWTNDLITVKLPKNPEALINDSVCTYFHRTGLLCGDCEDGYSPLVLSYNLSCVECPDGHKNWWKLILAGFVPLTIFYFFILAFNINVTSSRLRGVVWYSQVISMPSSIRIVLLALSIENLQQLRVAKAVIAFYSLWNLDLFRSITPDICLNVTTLQALALEYLIAFYPLVLIVFTYLLIVLNDRRVKCIVTIWKPFKMVLERFRRSWNIRTSVLDSFATFFLLSYGKVLSVSFDLLIPTKIYQFASNKSSFGLYYSPSVPYFGYHHLPYAVLAITVSTLFVLIPTIILIFYPCQIFQKFLSLFPINWHFLHAFVDSFQGCYKDGTEPGTLDCRWFSVTMLLIRLLLFIIYILTLSEMYFIYGLIALFILMIAMINIQPFKKINLHYFLADLVFTFLFSFSLMAMLGRALVDLKHFYYHTTLTIIALLTGLVPLLYITYLIVSWLLSKLCVPRLLPPFKTQPLNLLNN